MPARRGPLLPIWARVLIPVVLVAGLGTFQYTRRIPAIAAVSPVVDAVPVPGVAPVIPWPSAGEAAVAVTGLGLLGTSGGNTPLPIASVAKVMTALVVVGDKPLSASEQGPLVTITSADVADLHARAANQESIVDVAVGERISERQLLQGLLLPSGNNLAQVLARWDTGSVSAMVAKMNARAAALGMTSTTFADPAGVSTATVSTPRDLALLAAAAMSEPVLANIVGLTAALLPVAGDVFNIDRALGQDGIIGIKTGSSPDAGGCFMFASNQMVGDRQVMVYGAVLGQPQLDAALATSRAIAAAVGRGLVIQRAVVAGATLGRYTAPWGARTTAVAAASADVVAWPGLIVNRQTKLAPITAPTAAGLEVGSLTITLGDQVVRIPVRADRPIPRATTRWRLLRTS